jgi:hypothetical protein
LAICILLTLVLITELVSFFSFPTLCFQAYPFVLVIIYDTTYTTHAFTAAPRDEKIRPASDCTGNNHEKRRGSCWRVSTCGSRKLEKKEDLETKTSGIQEKREGQHLAKALLSAHE